MAITRRTVQASQESTGSNSSQADSILNDNDRVEISSQLAENLDREHESLLFVKRAMYMACTTYLKQRDLVSAHMFRRHTINGQELWTLDKYDGEEYMNILAGVGDAIERKYARELMVVASEGRGREDEALEVLTLRFVYAEEVGMQLLDSSNRPIQGVRFKNDADAKRQLAGLIANIVKLTSSLRKVPPRSRPVFNLHYYRGVPRDYNPPEWHGRVPVAYTFGKRSFDEIQLGGVSAKYHAIYGNMKTTLAEERDDSTTIRSNLEEFEESHVEPVPAFDGDRQISFSDDRESSIAPKAVESPEEFDGQSPWESDAGSLSPNVADQERASLLEETLERSRRDSERGGTSMEDLRDVRGSGNEENVDGSSVIYETPFAPDPESASFVMPSKSEVEPARVDRPSSPSPQKEPSQPLSKSSKSDVKKGKKLLKKKERVPSKKMLEISQLKSSSSSDPSATEKPRRPRTSLTTHRPSSPEELESILTNEVPQKSDNKGRIISSTTVEPPRSPKSVVTTTSVLMELPIPYEPHSTKKGAKRSESPVIVKKIGRVEISDEEEDDDADHSSPAPKRPKLQPRSQKRVARLEDVFEQEVV